MIIYDIQIATPDGELVPARRFACCCGQHAATAMLTEVWSPHQVRNTVEFLRSICTEEAKIGAAIAAVKV